jgi:hypothetical protein
MIYKIKHDFSNNVLSVLKRLKNSYIAGGWALSSVQRAKNIESKYSDVDLYFHTENDYLYAVDFLNKAIQKSKIVVGNWTVENPSMYLNYETDLARTYTIFGTEIQLIKTYFGNPESVTAKFDIDNSKYWSYFPFTVAHTNQPESTLYKIKTDKSNNFFCLQRIKKYYTEKQIDPENIFESVIKTISRDNIDFQRRGSDYDTDSEINLKIDYLNVFIDNKKFIELLNKSKINYEIFKNSHFNYYGDYYKKLKDPLLFFLFLEYNNIGNNFDITAYITPSDISNNRKKMFNKYPEYLL